MPRDRVLVAVFTAHLSFSLLFPPDMTLFATRNDLPMHLMHAGEEVLFVLVPIFMILALVDYLKRRRARSAPDEQADPHHGVSDRQEDQRDLG